MSKRMRGGSPGSHSHADQPNWRPAADLADYMENCREGLEEFSRRRVAKIVGMNRVELWRMEWAAKLPEELFERLMAKCGARRLSTKMLADIARAMYGESNPAEIECCPHCGGLLRVRQVSADVMAIVNEWIDERK